jgi:uncharacterized protein (DUF1501 family)
MSLRPKLCPLTRRQVLVGLPVTLVAATVGFGPVALALAAAPTARRLVVVILRGAMDGLAAVAPYGDPDYRGQRGPLALAGPGTEDGVLDLGGRFGLHPALAPLHDFYRNGEFAVLHAVASPYRGRSHFDGQDRLEDGFAAPHPISQGGSDGDSGWLNRALGLLPRGRSPTESRLGLAIGQTVPLVLRGAVPVGSWAPAALPEPSPDLMQRLAQLYQGDPVLAPALEEGLRSQLFADTALAGAPASPPVSGAPVSGAPVSGAPVSGAPVSGAPVSGAPVSGMSPGTAPSPDAPPSRRRGTGFPELATTLAQFLDPEAGPRVAVMELGGWDTHAGQGTVKGRLADALRPLAEGLAAFARTLAPAVWRQTVVVVVTEFGRTVAANGTGGTDHGTGGCAFLLGGAVAGGRVITDWPGLARPALFEGRDLMPTLDLRAAIKGVLRDHLGLPAAGLEATVFPGSSAVAPMSGLIRV